MAIDPMLYEKYSGRKGDPYSRLGDALAKNEKGKARRDSLPKGVSGGLRVSTVAGSWWNILCFWKWLSHSSRKD